MKFALSNEPTDIWSLEKKEKSSEENITIENSSRCVAQTSGHTKKS